MTKISIVSIIFVSFCMGIFMGSLWMFFAMLRTNKRLEKELDAKNKHLEKLEIDGLQEYYRSI